MKQLGQLATLTIVACLFWQMPAYAAENAYLYFVHGWPGRDVATNADPGFPVDILLNDESCYLRGFTFGNSNGPLSLPPGQYDIKISLANTMAPCTNTPLIESTVALESNQDVTAVLALDDSGVPLLSTFPNHFQPVAAGNARLAIDYAGEGLAISFVIKATDSSKTWSYLVKSGTSLVITLPAGGYTIDANVGGVTLASETVGLPQHSVTELFAVGNTANQSLIMVSRTVRDVL